MTLCLATYDDYSVGTRPTRPLEFEDAKGLNGENITTRALQGLVGTLTTYREDINTGAVFLMYELMPPVALRVIHISELISQFNWETRPC